MIEGEEKDTLYVVSYSQKELSDFTSKLENNGFKEYLESDKKETRNFIEKKYPNAPRSKVDEVLKEVYANSKITSSSIVKIGNSKAYCVDFNIVSTKFRRFAIPSLHRVTAIEFAYPETFDLESSKAYKDFVSSYKNKDQAPSSFNGFLYGTLGPNLLRLLIFVAIAIGTTVLKKLRGY